MEKLRQLSMIASGNTNYYFETSFEPGIDWRRRATKYADQFLTKGIERVPQPHTGIGSRTKLANNAPDGTKGWVLPC